MNENTRPTGFPPSGKTPIIDSHNRLHGFESAFARYKMTL